MIKTFWIALEDNMRQKTGEIKKITINENEYDMY